MKISIALCTHNGSQFLARQLESIRTQTRVADEIVLCDDASADGTLAIAERFGRECPIDFRVAKNPRRMGSTSNFEQAVAACMGDVIVLADQDDIWRPEKLAAIEDAFLNHPAAGFCFSDAAVVDRDLAPLGYTLWDALKFGPQEQKSFRDGRAFGALLRRHRATGATMAFRSKYRELVLPIPTGWVHDAWIALLISAVAPCELIESPLIQYRQHESQQHGGRSRSLVGEFRAARHLTRERCNAVAERYSEAFERLRNWSGVTQEKLELLRLKIEHHRRRGEMRAAGTWRFPHVISEAVRGNYRRYGQGWKTIAQDLLLR